MYRVAYISNCLGSEHRDTIRKISNSSNDRYFEPLECSISGIDSAVYLIPSLPEDLLNASGIREARKNFMAATRAADEKGVKVILLAASLKRLFGAQCTLKIDEAGGSDANGKTLAEHFPHILFTNGDNGTSYFFRKDIDNVLSLTGKAFPELSCAVIGAGLLGMEALRHLQALGIPSRQIQAVTRHPVNIQKRFPNHEIAILAESSEIDIKTDVIIICTHHYSHRLEKSRLGSVSKPVYVLDVAVPYGFCEEDYQYVKAQNDFVYRQDGGNAYCEEIRFHFNPALIGLQERMLYGCFAEATALGIEMGASQRSDINELDLFSVNQVSGKMIDGILARHNFTIPPSPRCFDVEIKKAG